MQSPCLKDVAEVCSNGCFPSPFISHHHDHDHHHHHNESPKKAPKSKSTSAACRHEFAAATASSIFPDAHFTDHESLPPLQQSFYEFAKVYQQYFETSRIDEIRDREYSHLSASNRTCLDYLGIGLFSYSQMKTQQLTNQQQQATTSSSSSSSHDILQVPFFGLAYKTGSLKTQLLHGGPESELESVMKNRIMSFLNVSETDYAMVFTANKTSAFKLVAESYPFQSSSKLLTVYDYESEAVETMIKSSQKKGAEAMSAEFSWPRLRIQSAKLKKMVVRKNKNKKKKRGLFVFPLHSRLTGARYPYLWMNIAEENGWHVMIDACALGPKDMNSFGLSLCRPDLLVCSFYKVFGENPSGFGCLFVKKSIISVLETASPCSGMVSLIPVEENNTGTVINLQTSVTECRALDQVDSLGLNTIGTRSRCLINWLVNAFMKLHHPNTENVPLVRIYGPQIKFDRGPALAFNVFDWKGEKVEPVLVQKLADRNNISLSYGFLHHIWFADKYQEEKNKVLERRMISGTTNNGSGISVVTAALGFLANFEDVYKVWCFIAQFLDADFVEKERWRYTALNQKLIEL